MAIPENKGISHYQPKITGKSHLIDKKVVPETKKEETIADPTEKVEIGQNTNDGYVTVFPPLHPEADSGKADSKLLEPGTYLLSKGKPPEKVDRVPLVIHDHPGGWSGLTRDPANEPISDGFLKEEIDKFGKLKPGEFEFPSCYMLPTEKEVGLGWTYNTELPKGDIKQMPEPPVRTDPPTKEEIAWDKAEKALEEGNRGEFDKIVTGLGMEPQKAEKIIEGSKNLLKSFDETLMANIQEKDASSLLIASEESEGGPNWRSVTTRSGFGDDFYFLPSDFTPLTEEQLREEKIRKEEITRKNADEYLRLFQEEKEKGNINRYYLDK